MDWQIVTAVGVIATALIALLQFRYLRSRDLPAVIAVVHQQRDDLPHKIAVVHQQHDDLPHKMDFKLLDANKWMIAGIRIRGACKPHLTLTSNPTRNEYGEFVGYLSDGPWQRRITFDPPVSSGFVLLRSDVHDRFTVLFTACLRANPRVRRRVPVRCSIVSAGARRPLEP